MGFDVTIGNNIYIGAGARVFANVGDNVIIGANSVINKPITDNCRVAGVPAKIIDKVAVEN